MRRAKVLRILSRFLFVVMVFGAGRILLSSFDAQDGWPTWRAWLAALLVVGVGAFVLMLGKVIADISDQLRESDGRGP